MLFCGGCNRWRTVKTIESQADIEQYECEPSLHECLPIDIWLLYACLSAEQSRSREQGRKARPKAPLRICRQRVRQVITCVASFQALSTSEAVDQGL